MLPVLTFHQIKKASGTNNDPAHEAEKADIVATRRRRSGRNGLYLITLLWMAVLLPLSVAAAPYAAMVMDARNGQVIHAENADARLHPASLTKMMTLYIAFEAVERGEISMDTVVTVSRKAAGEQPSRLGLRAGQKIKLRYLVRAAAVKSANDASTAIAEAISGSEAAFARRMNRTAKAMGMTRTTFKNAHGLTESGHLSTARDMTILGRHVIYDYPQYYNLFSRMSADAGVGRVSHTNRRLLESYRGADGIKTGYTRAAGFNLVASAERGNERVIATVFGGRSTASRNERVAELLDLGFRKAPSRVAMSAPGRPDYVAPDGPVVVKIETPDPVPGQRAKSIRVAAAAVSRSLRPQPRPGSTVAAVQVAEVIRDEVAALLAEAQQAPEATTPVAPAAEAAEVLAEAAPETAVVVPQPTGAAPATSPKPPLRPEGLVLARALPDTPEDVDLAEAETESEPEGPEAPKIVTRISTNGGQHWGINVGRFPDRFQAEKALMKTALLEMETLDGSLRKVVNGAKGFDANFLGLSRDMADLACRRLQARQMMCFMIGPS